MTRPHSKQIREAARLIAEAERPILYVGGGVVRARASEELRRFVELSQIPVVTTLMARGALPDSHPLHLGMPGMHGSVSAVTGLQKADLLITLGARFDDRVTGQLKTFAPGAKVIHADIDPAEISKNRKADVPIVGDCQRGPHRPHRGRRRRHRRRSWWRLHRVARAGGRLEGDASPLGYTVPEGGTLAPQYVIERLSAIVGPEACYVAGVGQHQMWAAQFVAYERPNSWLNSGGLGTMGYAVPAAMGAQVGEPDRTVWAIDGDGCFQMTNQELATCVINNIPIKVAIINNSSLGMVRQWQTLFYNERYSNTDLHTSVGSRVPDFVKLAEAYGCAGFRCERPEDVDATIRAAMEVNDRPVVVDFVVHRDAMVWPMVPAGVSNDLIQVARDTAPQWDREESEARRAGRSTPTTTGCPRAPVRTEGGTTMSKHTLSVLVENKPGVLARIAALFSRRGFNIDSLAVGETEYPDVSRMTVVVDVEDLPLEQVTKQLNKLVEVLKVVELEPQSAVQRQVMLIKVRADAGTRSQVLEMVQMFRAKVVDVATDSLTIEATGNTDKLKALLDVLEPYGVKELVQSGLVAIGRGPRSITDRALRSA